MKTDFEKTVNNLSALRDTHPIKFKEVIKQFKDMASGGDGGYFFSSNSRFIVRKLYYRGWSNSDFSRVLQELGIEE